MNATRDGGAELSRDEIQTPHVIHETIDGEVVVINLESGNYYSLRGTGARVWAAIVHGASPDGIVQDLHASYEGARDVAPAVTGFLAELRAEGLIRPSAAEAAGPPPPAASRTPYEPPVLEAFTDMQDLILLDPVHEVDEAQGWPRAKST